MATQESPPVSLRKDRLFRITIISIAGILVLLIPYLFYGHVSKTRHFRFAEIGDIIVVPSMFILFWWPALGGLTVLSGALSRREYSWMPGIRERHFSINSLFFWGIFGFFGVRVASSSFLLEWFSVTALATLLLLGWYSSSNPTKRLSRSIVRGWPFITILITTNILAFSPYRLKNPEWYCPTWLYCLLAIFSITGFVAISYYSKFENSVIHRRHVIPLWRWIAKYLLLSIAVTLLVIALVMSIGSFIIPMETTYAKSGKGIPETLKTVIKLGHMIYMRPPQIFLLLWTLTRIFHGIAETGGSVGLARRMGEVWGEQA